MGERVEKTDVQWREILSQEEFEVCRRNGTERPFSGEYYRCNEKGTYCCTCCGNPLFKSESKFDSRCGWPSFSAPADDSGIWTEADMRFGMQRVEVLCGSCDAHLGHVFDDGPEPTRLRYCINSVALKLEKEG